MESPQDRRPQRDFNLNLTSLDTQSNMATADIVTPYHSYSPTSTFHHSYLSHKSAPSTPGPLAHPRSSARLHSSRSKHFNRSSAELARPQSAIHLPDHGRARVSANTARSRRVQKDALRMHADDEWLFRTGAMVAGEVGESKGQTWLAQRASSTSLVNMDEDSDEQEEYATDRGVSPWEVRRRRLEHDARSRSQAASAKTSRVVSRAQSTRASRSSSRADLEGLSMSMTAERGRNKDDEDYFGSAGVGGDGAIDDDLDELHAIEDGGDTENEAEEEVARLTRDKSFGLGSWLDKFMTWTVFGDDDVAQVVQQSQQEEAQRPDKETSIGVDLDGSVRTAGSAEHSKEEELKAAEEGGIVNDTLWLMSQASKILI